MRPKLRTLVLAVPPLAAAGIVAALVLYARVSALLGDAPELFIADVWVALGFPLAGAWLLTRAHRAGWVLLGCGTLAVVALGTGWAIYDAIDGELRVVGSVAAWFAAWTWTPYLLVPTLVPILHVDPRLQGRGTRGLATAAITVAGLATLASAFGPGPISDVAAVENPLGLASAPWLRDVVEVCGAATFLLLAPLSVIVAAHRTRRAPLGASARGVLLASAALVLISLLADAFAYPWNDVVSAVGLSLLPLAVVISVREAEIRSGARLAHERLVRAREDERQRLRRELHDGLGPELAGIRLRLAAASATLPEASRAQIDEAMRRLGSMTGDVRRLVDGLRPEALDEVGLTGALRSRCDLLTSDACQVTCSADYLPPLSAAVETAAYQIASEALTNAVRHARAGSIAVFLSSTADDLLLEVADDGSGGAGAPADGVGMSSMRLRATELGGNLDVDSRPTGTTVRARLPLEGPA